CIYIYFAEKNEFKYTIHFLFVFVVLYVVSTAVFWQGALDIIPLITGTIYTFAYAIKNLQVMRYVLIVPNILLIIYNIMSTTYVSAVLDFIEVVVLIIAIIKFAKGIRAKKQTLN
ncbi:MAG: YgjV family protein, partial [Clostridia bacterium]|nr:YgjV family protein [Clostridia bacterium]